MRRPLRTLLLLGLVLALGTGGALASNGPHGNVRAKARTAPGQLQLSGTGAITLNGQLTAFGVIPEDGGSLSVQDQRGDATVTLNGARQSLRGRRLNLKRAQGSFYIQGSKVSARVQGNNISLSAAGRGQALVAGIGNFILNGGDSQQWPPGYGVIDLLPPARPA